MQLELTHKMTVYHSRAIKPDQDTLCLPSVATHLHNSNYLAPVSTSNYANSVRLLYERIKRVINERNKSPHVP